MTLTFGIELRSQMLENVNGGVWGDLHGARLLRNRMHTHVEDEGIDQGYIVIYAAAL